jgi:hypothetical protein
MHKMSLRNQQVTYTCHKTLLMCSMFSTLSFQHETFTDINNEIAKIMPKCNIDVFNGLFIIDRMINVFNTLILFMFIYVSKIAH